MPPLLWIRMALFVLKGMIGGTAGPVHHRSSKNFKVFNDFLSNQRRVYHVSRKHPKLYGKND
jgi:hypothetical protein